ncbi:MAG: hypothetical protein ACRDG6_12200 [Candidatus Limnocylindria bacterium]
MTDEVDPRLVALGLVPGPAATPAPPTTDWETAAPPKPTDWVVPTAPAPAPAPPPPPSSTPSVVMPGHKPLTIGDLFPGMGKFTGTPGGDAPAAPPPPPQSFAPTPSTFTPPPESFAPTAPPEVTPPQGQTHTPPPAYTPPSYTPPAYAPVAPAAPEAPLREAPPPLPPLAAAMPTATRAVEAPAIPTKKEKAKKEKAAKVPKAAKAAKPAKPAKLEVAKPEKVKPAPKPRFVLPPSGVLLRGPIVMGYPEQKLQITLEQLGFRIDGKEPIDVAWTDVRDIKPRRGRVVVRTKGRPVAFGIPVEGVAEPTLSGPLARVVKEASGGSLDLAGSAFLELQNATDSLRDRFHDEDDPLVPTVVGLVFGLGGLTFTAILPDALAIATRSPIAPGAYLLDHPLAGFDPRVLAAAFAAAAMLAAGIVRVAMGKAATAWARGTLRGWNEVGRRPILLARRALAAIVLNPAIAAAVLLAGVVLTLPSLRVQTVIDQSGFHITTAFPLFDENRAWSSVTDVRTVDAPTTQHFEGVAVVFTFKDKGPLSTLDGRLRGGSDRQLVTSAEKWRAEHAP